MSRPHSEDALREKQKAYCIKTTTRFHGAIKDLVLNDCIRRGICEADLIREIVGVHYGIISEAPEFKAREFTELKKWIIDRIKL